MRMSWSFALALAACGGTSKHVPDAGVRGGDDMASHADFSTTGDLALDLATLSDMGTTRNDVYITWYGFNDNSCQIESQHDCNTIAFPMSDGWTTPHNIATEGTGAYDSPSTFATAANDDGSNAEIAIGTLIYVPSVRKYFVMEDQCAECGTDFAAGHYHTDLWMGPSYGSDTNDLDNCEDKLTIGSASHGTGTIVIDPPSNLPVDTTPLFSNNACTAHQY